MYTLIIIKKNLLFFVTEYKNEHKEHKFWRQKNQKKRLLQKQEDTSDR